MKLPSFTPHLIKGMALALLVVLTVYLYPRYQHTFAFRYEIGKPWSYDKLVADFDFPIYKSENQLETERQEILADALPYYTFVAGRPHRPLVMAIQERDRLQEMGIDRIAILNNQVAQTYNLREINTPKTAYMVMGQEIAVNLALDTATTNQVKRELLRNISLTRGVVQTGEKIVDNGDIVDEHTASILRSLKIAYEQAGVSNRLSAWSIVGTILTVLLFMGLFGLYLYVFRRTLFEDTKAVLFFCLLPAIIIIMACLLTRYSSMSVYLIPLMWVPILVRCFYDARTAFALHLTTTIVVSFITPDPFEFVFIQIATGIVALASMKEMTQRAQLAQTAGWIFVAYALSYTTYILGTAGAWTNINAWNYLYFALNAILIIGSYGLIFLFEKLFRLLSPITLVELTDINSALLLEFAEKAPGSFHHSMQVSTLAMEAAKRIGAKSLLVRTGALYHDIGKMTDASYYTENQQDGVNPLLSITPQDAAKIVKNHVCEGVAIARAHHLPEVIINFIQTHHGTSLTRYFYNVAIAQGCEVNENDFRYDGPKPTTKEAAILMMADAVEARSRSLSNYTEENVNEMVDDMINLQINEGQFSETPLSFRDVEAIRQVFKERLLSMNHHRITYPTNEPKS